MVPGGSEMSYGKNWVKYYRKSLEDPLFRRPLIWHFFQYCLLKANREAKKVNHGGKTMIIPEGCFIFGRKKAAEETGLSEQNIRTALVALGGAKALAKVPRLSTNKFSVLKVCKFPEHQAKPDGYQPADQPATNQQLTTNKNIENIENTNPVTTFQDYKAEFEDWWARWKRKITRGPGNRGKSLGQFRSLREKFTYEQIITSTTHYFQVCKRDTINGSPTANKDAERFLIEGLIKQHLSPPDKVAQPAKEGQFNPEDQGWKPAEEHYGKDTDLMKDYNDSLKIDGAPYAN